MSSHHSPGTHNNVISSQGAGVPREVQVPEGRCSGFVICKGLAQRAHSCLRRGEKRWIPMGPLHWGQLWSRGRSTLLQLGQQNIPSVKMVFPGCPCSSSSHPFGISLSLKHHHAQPPNCDWLGAVPLAVSMVLARLRLCRPLGHFSTCRLKATIPDERAESPEQLCQCRQVSVPP